MRKLVAWYRLALVGSAMAIISGCTSWSRPAALAPEQFRESRVWEARVSLRDSLVQLKDPTIATDSIVGTDLKGRRAAVALGDVEYVSVRRSDLLRSTALVAGGIAAAMLTFGLLFTLDPPAT